MLLLSGLFNKEYIPTYITAAAGILGIIFNISLDIYFRSTDRRISRKEKQIAAIENYYLPIYVRTDKLWKQFSELIEMNVEFVDIVEYLRKTKHIPVRYECKLIKIADTLHELDELISNNEFKYLGYYKTFVYQMRINGLIEYLSSSPPDMVFYKLEDCLNMNFIDKYNKYLGNTVEFIYAPNTIYYFFIKVEKALKHLWGKKHI